MQSSTAIAIRALVMLIVLISVPLFAIFGKNVPEVIKGLLEGRGLVLSPAAGGDANQNTVAPLAGGNTPNQPAPYRVPANATTASSAAAPLLNSANQPAMERGGSGAGSGEAARGDAAHGDRARGEISRSDLFRNAPQPGSWPRVNDPTDLAAAGTAGQWHDPPTPNFSAPNGAGIQSPGAGVQTTGFQAPLGGPGGGSAQPQMALRSETTLRNDLVQSTPYSNSPPGNRPGQPGAALPTASDERFRQAEVQLRQLGASYYMLETWGPDNNRYRFSCKMPIGGNAGVNRLFQAVDEDPLLAMNNVLRQISQWRMQTAQAAQ